jgi:hypothetical protein
MKILNLKPEDEKIEFFHYPDTKMLSINVPAHVATDDFRREVKTAQFVSVALIHPQEQCEHGSRGFNQQVRVTFDDGSEAPYSILAGIGDFHVHGNPEKTHLPTVNTLRIANVVIYDETVEDAVVARRMSAADALKASLVWMGKAETNIRRTRSGGYRDGCVSVELYG